MTYNMEHNGYKLFLKNKGLNYFMKKVNGKFIEIICTDLDLINGNIEFMSLYDLSICKK